ncbi:MAG: hypothetical protein A2521_00920 [Deltaproteobacteria bacterium RIFOXYD12_FULL_57_12]|nr:MAG: hypothetical protein A2521_00920 [Deltaproteobacteria bacterium RIFOXYD12_FULL_57_12]
MSITQQIDRIIRARWNPGEWFYIEDIVRTAKQESITFARSTIQRTMQEVRDLGTIQFSTSRGHYKRQAVGIEKEGDRQSIAKQAALSVAGDFNRYNWAKQMAADRVMRLMTEEAEDSRIVEDIRQIEKDTPEPTERWSLVRTRLGQGEFRKKLVDYWNRCAVTGCKLTRVLRASHIKPWRYCTDEERLDVYNGLLLLPNVDSLFDIGLITISATGEVQKSILLQYFDGDHFGIPEEVVVPLEPSHQPYLEYHRNTIFSG